MKIKVLEVIGDSSLAGAPRHFLSILENLDLERFEISAICPPGPLAGEIRSLRRHIELDVINMNSRFSLESIRKIRAQIKHVKPQLIHIHGTRAGALARLAAIGLNIPVIYTEHLWTKEFHLDNRFLNFLHFSGYWFLDLFTNLNIAVSGAVKEFLIDSGISRDGKIKIIYNGIEPARHSADIFRHEEILIGTVGTLNHNKGIQFLIRALPLIRKEFPTARLEIIGDGPYKKNLVQEVKKCKLGSAVKFVGFVADVERYLSKFDCYVQPSLSESFGLAIVQAMSLGLPVVATHTGGIPEIITQGITGFLIPPKKPRIIAESVIEILRDKEKARKMGQTARKEVQIKFNLKDMMSEIEKVYEQTHKDPSFH